MKDFLKILKRYLPPYKKHIFLNVIFNFLGALFGIFSFITMIPALKILFNSSKKVYGFLDLESSLQNIREMKKILEHNLYAYITKISEEHSAVLVLIYIGIFLICMVLLKVSLTYLASFYIVYIRNGVVRDIRNQINRKILDLPVGFFTEERKGDIIARMTGDVQELEVSIMNSLDMFFKNPIIISLSILTMVIMSWKLTLFVLILFPLSGIIIGRIGKSLKRRSLAGQNKMGELLSTIEETLSGLRIIKAFTAEKKIEDRFCRQNESYRGIMNRLMRRHHLAHPVSEFLGTAVIVLVMWYGGYLILRTDNSLGLDPEEFLVYLVVFYNIINPAKAFSSAFYNIQKGLAAITRIDKILYSRSDITEIKNPVAIKKFSDKIEYRNVSFRYQKDYVLKNINLTINKGKTIALVGQSGAGKSTMVDLLPRFYDVTEGKILIDSHNVRDLNLHDLRNLMGIVTQEPILFNDSFLNNIAFGVDNASEEEIISAAKIANAHEFIVSTKDKYDTNIGDRGTKLSGGQRQRISIARAILKNPPILILDEATSSLDSESEKLVQDAIIRLMENRTSIVIAHRLSTIMHADEICVLKEGKIVERGKHDKLLLSGGEYKKFYELQSFN
jgi:subfamily B ATP-binding cassette protein MsbA